MTAMAWLRWAGSRSLDLLLPPQCLSCGTVVGEPGALCQPCWTKVTFLGEPACACCGFPFDLQAGDSDDLCGICARRRPLYRQARAVMAYDDGSRRLILAFKHGDRTDAAPAFGLWLARVGAEMLRNNDILAPVPLHRWRLAKRRYNQAALLTRELGRLSGLANLPDLLARHRSTPPQGTLNPAERRRNVRDAFAVRPKHLQHLSGRRVLLVDDVFTTGATVEACAKALLAAGAASVDVLTVARVVRSQV